MREDMPPRVAEIQARLLANGAETLAARWVEHLLSRPARALIDAAWLADLAVATLEATADNPQTEAFFRARVRALREHVPKGSGRDALPPDVVGPLREVLTRPVVPDPVLVRRLLRHEATERLLKDTLVGALQSFARRLRAPPMPTGPSRGLGRLRDALGESQGLLGALSQEIERQAETKAKEFVESALQTVMDEVATHLCSPDHAARYGQYRAYLLDTLLDTDLKALAAEVDKLDPESLIATGTAIARAIARRPALRGELRSLVESAVESAGDSTIRELLAEGGLDEAVWRGSLEALVAREAKDFVATEVFAAWLGEMMEIGGER